MKFWHFIIPFFIATSSTTLMADTIYKWVDDNGRTHYSNRPLADNANPLGQEQADHNAVQKAEPDYAPIKTKAPNTAQQRSNKAAQKLIALRSSLTSLGNSISPNCSRLFNEIIATHEGIAALSGAVDANRLDALTSLEERLKEFKCLP